MQVLKGLKVVDFGLGMAPALVTKFLVDAGASATRVAPENGDPFSDYYPTYDVWRRGQASFAKGPEELDSLLGAADFCVLGGEDFPGVARGPDPADLAARFPRLIVLDIQAYPEGSSYAGRPATDVLVQARSGLAYEHFKNRPILMSFEPANYGAALLGLLGLMAALYERETSGLGQVVTTSLFEGALSWTRLLWGDFEKPTDVTRFVTPMDPYPLVFPGSDGAFIHIVVASAGSKYKMYQALEIDDPSVLPTDSGMPQPHGDPRNFYGDVDVLAEHAAKISSGEMLKRIGGFGLPAEPVLPPGACWSEPQVEHNGIIATDADGTRHVGFPVNITFSKGVSKARPLSGTRPLDGIGMLDFGAFVAGPLATVLLGDLGADVIKIETPAGDPTRGIVRSFNGANRGKRAIAVNLKTPEGLRIAQSLAERVDVVTSNFRSGVASRLGIGQEQLHAIRPDMVILESPAYGSTGPQAERAGFDQVMQALCGHEHRAGGRGNDPLWNRTNMVDIAGATLGAISAVLALYQRGRTGEGAAIEDPLVNAGIFLLSELAQRPDGRFEGADQLNPNRSGYHPSEAMYQAEDGWIAIAARGSEAATRLADLLGIADRVQRDTRRWGDAEGELIAETVKIHTVDSLLKLLDQEDIWAERCQQGMEAKVLEDPDLLRLAIVAASDHPTYGRVREIGTLMRFSRSAYGTTRHTPVYGEANAEVLRECGFSEAEIDDFTERKIVC